MIKKIYLRDGRAPIPEKELTSRIMSSIKGKDTKPELLLRRALSRLGIRGYRIHSNSIEGKPDITFPGKKIAIFVHGCFWHRCPECQLTLPKTHSEFWKVKFEKNVSRDERINQSLKAKGWTVLTVWECQIKDHVDLIANNIKKKIDEDRNRISN